MPIRTPLDRMALIAELTKRHHEKEKNRPLGKTALQKFMYFLQEVDGVNCGYDFALHTYGPYSSTLQADVDSARAFGFVTIQYDQTSGGYQITPGTETRPSEYLSEAHEALDRILDNYASFTAKNLELRATIVYSERELRSDRGKVDDDQIIEVVHGLKPRFNKRQILTALNELRSKGYVAEKEIS